ncbi:L-aspartate oxidase [Cryobacterium sp. PH31-O1]|uniref:L-aspartate oxidase n=1 Tax=Cryobacterium sp. PH31-O1 TaxID=3046306 RepID=UPI0024B8A8E9|nr:L-aspartate oxidase [Cryobacterium sp. PH31-O1]MDJ0337521.1 L-aspartate oxidase [Cryobacterium sp. PH31-O1]
MAAILVIGSGLGGLLAAVRAADAGHRVVLVTKSVLPESNTRYAQGGIAAALFRDDSVDAHELDTLRAGAGLCDPAAVRVLCEEGPARVRDLIRFGVDFDRDESGVARGLEAAHSRSRVVHAGGDATGAAVEAALVATVRRRAAIDVQEHTMLVDLLVDDDGAVSGARVLGPDGVQRSLEADAVILATGGAGALFTHTTNPSVATGDGVAAAWRAGASVADLEFYQFHPTALAVPGTPLVSEAVRGEGAVLRNQLGERFMLAEHPDAELAPRDVVARAIARQMERQGGAPVLLDATALGRELLETRFPTITAACRAAKLDWAVQAIPVAPAAHYSMGGVETDAWARTTLPGLFAVGEVARTGAHGANRLASNSLLEAAVFADRAVRALGQPWPTGAFLPPMDPQADNETHWANRLHPLVEISTSSMHGLPSETAIGLPSGDPGTPIDRSTLRQLLWDFVGVHRSGAGLAHAAAALAEWTAPSATSVSVAALEDRNLLGLGRLLVAAALAREESRGAHYRSDFPHPRPELARSVSQAHSPSLELVPTQEAIAC